MSASALKPPLWFTIAAGAGLLWNMIGAWQFIAGFSATPESLAAMGFTPEQVTLMRAEPLWLTIANGLAGGPFVARGGGIYNAGTLTVLNSTLSGNTASTR